MFFYLNAYANNITRARKVSKILFK